ncbi:MAG: uracil-DNA glycosylase [Pyrinomonadaceae bacterium]
MSSTKRKRFLELSREAQKCLTCEAMRDKTAVLSELNGHLSPKVFFIAEAPGRQGADRTRRPFWGDKSGENFQRFLDSIELRREQIFITNAVLCSPRKPSGANRNPKKSEVRNCSDFLRRTIELINPKIIATLGSVALEALKLLEYHQLSLKTDVGKIQRWNGRLLIPLYHPSPQVLASHRRESEQLEDYQVLARAIGRSTGAGR